MLQAAQEAEGSSTSSSEDELADAQVAVEEATSSGRIKAGNGGTLGSVFEVATLIFLAEWGDRSMLATIALGAAQVCGAGMGVGVAISARMPRWCWGRVVREAYAHKRAGRSNSIRRQRHRYSMQWLRSTGAAVLSTVGG